MAKKTQSPELTSSLFTSLPHDIIVDIVARVPRCDYPAISLVSKSFGSLVASPDLYTRRALLGCTEHCLYVVLHNIHSQERRCYIIRRKVNNNRLVMIRSLPPMRSRGQYIAVGSKIYVLDGYSAESALTIDCRSHTVQPISKCPKSLLHKFADIIDEKIYVIGGCLFDSEVSGGKEWCARVMVLDTKTQMWEPEMIKPDMELAAIWPQDVVAVEDRIYMRDRYNDNIVYIPEGNIWETDETMNSKRWENPCVIDDVLYYYDDLKEKLKAYDPKQRCWRVVKGLEELLTKTAGSRFSHTVSYGENWLCSFL